MLAPHVVFQTFNILESCTTNTAVSSLHISMLISDVSFTMSHLWKISVAHRAGKPPCNKRSKMITLSVCGALFHNRTWPLIHWIKKSDMHYVCSSYAPSNIRHSWALRHKRCSQQFAHLHVDFWCVFYNDPFVKSIGCTQGRQISLQ